MYSNIYIIISLYVLSFLKAKYLHHTIFLLFVFFIIINNTFYIYNIKVGKL